MNKVIAALLLLLAKPVLAGSGAHGADIEADQNNAWFLGKDPIPYCITLEKGSNLTREEASQLIDEAFEDWFRFFDRHGYTKVNFDDINPFKSYGIKFPDGVSRGLSLDKRAIETCGAPKHQLEIRFSKSAEADWSVDSNHAFGAAIRGPYDHKEYRTGGLVWISAALQSDEERKHILLHELGHVFGMSHNSTYVMFEKVGRLIENLRGVSKQTANRPALGVIESASWKYMIWPGDELMLDNVEISSAMKGSFSGTPPFLGNPLLSPMLLGPRQPTKLTYLGRAGAGEFRFVLQMKTYEKDRTLVGSFQRRYHQFEVGPSLHTEWAKDGKPFPGRIYLELTRTAAGVAAGGGSKQIPLEGVFSDSDGVYPAMIEFPFGAVVKFYDIKSGTWYTLSSYPYEAAP